MLVVVASNVPLSGLWACVQHFGCSKCEDFDVCVNCARNAKGLLDRLNCDKDEETHHQRVLAMEVDSLEADLARGRGPFLAALLTCDHI